MGGAGFGYMSRWVCLVIAVLVSFGHVECRELVPAARAGDPQVKKPQWLFDGNPNTGWFGGGGGGGFGGGGGVGKPFSFGFGKGYGFSFGSGSKPPGFGAFRKPTSASLKP